MAQPNRFLNKKQISIFVMQQREIKLIVQLFHEYYYILYCILECGARAQSGVILFSLLVIVPDGVGGALGRRPLYTCLKKKLGILIMPMCVCLCPVLCVCVLWRRVLCCAPAGINNKKQVLFILYSPIPRV